MPSETLFARRIAKLQAELREQWERREQRDREAARRRRREWDRERARERRHDARRERVMAEGMELGLTLNRGLSPGLRDLLDQLRGET